MKNSRSDRSRNLFSIRFVLVASWVTSVGSWNIFNNDYVLQLI